MTMSTAMSMSTTVAMSTPERGRPLQPGRVRS